MMNTPTNIMMFPGQGAQQKGMGGFLFDQSYLYRQLESQVNDILGYDLKSLCLYDEDNQLGETQYTQPALYVINALHYFKSLERGIKPNVLIGHSLGEYNALLAAGCFDFLTGLQIVQKRGQLMSQAVGGMMAIFGLSKDEITEQLTLFGRDGDQGIDIANINSPSQIIVSGNKKHLQHLQEHLGESAVKAVMLPVSAAFHSRHMRPLAEAFHTFLSVFDFKSPQYSVIANATNLSYPADSAGIASLLTQQLYSPVNWLGILKSLKAEFPGAQFIETGHGQVLTRLFQELLPNHQVA